MNSKLALIVAFIFVVSGCQSTGDKGTLEQENTNLKQEVATAKVKINQLSGSNLLLKKDIEGLNHVISVLDTEKNSRVEESSLLRSQVRKFVQKRIDALKIFLVEGNLLDYTGGELVERSVLSDKPITVVDLGHVMPEQGVLTAVGAFVMTPTKMKVKVLRKMDDKLVPVWESNHLNMDSSGLNTIQFKNSVSVEKGDVIAYEFSGNVGVGFETGTGNYQYTKDILALGKAITVSSLLGKKEKRSYSLGVFGLLD